MIFLAAVQKEHVKIKMATSGCGIEWLILKYIYKLNRLL
jgi:hypothetical protein